MYEFRTPTLCVKLQLMDGVRKVRTLTTMRKIKRNIGNFHFGYVYVVDENVLFNLFLGVKEVVPFK